MGKTGVTKGRLVVVSGPSGVGKSTICRQVVRRLKDVYLSISVTTRPKGNKEVEGRDYWFISRQEFERRIRDGLLLEYAEVFGNLYGTPRDKVEEALGAGKTVILEIDVEGARKAKEIYPGAVMVFILPPTQKELAERMNSRGRENGGIVDTRLARSEVEIAAAWRYYDHMVINDDLEQAVDEVAEIVEAGTGEN